MARVPLCLESLHEWHCWSLDYKNFVLDISTVKAVQGDAIRTKFLYSHFKFYENKGVVGRPDGCADRGVEVYWKNYAGNAANESRLKEWYRLKEIAVFSPSAKSMAKDSHCTTALTVPPMFWIPFFQLDSECLYHWATTDEFSIVASELARTVIQKWAITWMKCIMVSKGFGCFQDAMDFNRSTDIVTALTVVNSSCFRNNGV